MSSFGQFSSQDLYGPSARLLLKKNPKKKDLHPPIGASPGELRLWMKQNGLLNEPALPKRLSSVGRRVSAARLPPLRPSNTNVPAITEQHSKRQFKAEADMEAKAVDEQAEAAKREARRAARREAKERAQAEAREQAEAARALAAQAEAEAAERLEAQRKERKKEAASWRLRREEQQQQKQQAEAEAKAEAQIEMEAEARADAVMAARSAAEAAATPADTMVEAEVAEVESVLADEAAALARIAAAEADEVLVVEPEEEDPTEEAEVEPVPPKVTGVRPLSPVAAITIEVPAAREEDAVEEVKAVSAAPADTDAGTAAATESAPMELGSELYVGDDDDFEADFEEEDLELP